MSDIAEPGTIERAIIHRSVEALRPILDPAHGAVVADYQRRQLRTSAGSIVIDLERLFEQLAEAPAPQWPERIEIFITAAARIEQTVQKLRLQDWTTVAGRLMVRVLPRRSAGPVGRPIGHGLTLDMGIDLDKAIAIPTATHVASWSQPTETLISTARGNSRRTLQPMIRSTELEVGGVSLKLSLLLSDPWVTGAIIDLDHFIKPREAAQRPEHRRFASVLGPTTLAVLESIPARQTRSSPAAVRSAVEQVVSGWFGRALPALSTPPADLPSYNLFEVHSASQIQDQIRAI